MQKFRRVVAEQIGRVALGAIPLPDSVAQAGDDRILADAAGPAEHWTMVDLHVGPLLA